MYGKDCTIYYGDWSAAESLRGCAPSPTSSMRKLFNKIFRVVTVDEFRTSSICNVCHYKLEKYRKRDGKLSYARLLQEMWTRQKKRSKHFVDRDDYAAKNILLVGRSLERPACFKRRFPAPKLPLGRYQGTIEWPILRSCGGCGIAMTKQS